MAVLQAWPGRGFWQGRTHGGSGTLAQMVTQMATTSQPHLFASAVSAFGGFDLAHGWAVNLFVVVSLAVVGVLLCTSRLALVRAGLYAGAVLCAADWLFVQDLGIFGGTGTDPNTMPPLALLLVVGYVAIARAPAEVTASVRSVTTTAVPAAGVGPADGEPEEVGKTATHEPWWARLSGKDLVRALAALGALAVVMVGAVPMAFASVNPTGDPIVTEVQNGTPDAENIPAPAFDLVDQSGKQVSLGDLRGKAVALTFLDPVCSSDCPVIAQEFREADSMLGSQARHVEFVAIDTNQLYTSVAAVDAFDRQEGMNTLDNWLYLTGPAPQLEKIWDSYGVQEQVEPAGAMVAHTDIAYVIDRSGWVSEVLGANPVTGAAGTTSFAGLLSSEIRNVLH
jgi:cytochrome oxidase Cu insertion factor (SCO1/SenC/PrrC family)